MSSLFVCRNGLDGPPSMKSNNTQPVMDKAKAWQMELLMEKLRSKAGQYKTFNESAKMLRMALLEKRYPADGVERVKLQKCLDTLQNSIRVTTFSGMVERLESVTRQLGLKFTWEGGAATTFIYSDMFYVEVVLGPSGDVKDVKIQHEGKQERQSCEELVSCLQQQDFSDFAAQLEGLASIYKINAEQDMKRFALNALQSLEADLTTLSTLQSMDAQSMLCKSPVGILLKRRGGHAMRLTYWVSPYDLLDQKSMSEVDMTVEQVNKRNLGYSVTVCIEASSAHNLQIAPLVTTQRGSNGLNVPAYNSLQEQNGMTLPACFALRLHEPLPLCVALARRIQLVTEMECGDLSTPHPLLSLITQHASQGQLDCANNNGLIVNLPDQSHCYRMTETKGLEAVMVTNIPFTHPKQVPHILGLLRQQAVFNSLISSCIRSSSRQDFDVILLEVTALTWQHLSISLEHPQEESMTTVEFDLADPSSIQCNISGAGSSASQSVTPEFAAKVVQRCMSIPVTMRSLIKRWQNQTSLTNGHSNGNGNFNLPLGSGGGGSGGGSHHDDSGRHGMSDMNMRDPHIKLEPHDNSSNDMADSAGGFSSFHSPMLGDISISPMSSFAGSSSMMNQSKEPVVINLMSEAVPKKKNRKRKVMENLWRSPKHKGDDCEILVESSSNESTPHGTPTSRDAPADFRIPTPTSIEFPHLMEEGKPDPTSADKGQSEPEGMSDDVMEIHEVDSVGEMLKGFAARKIKKPREERKSPSSIMLDIDGKSMVPPSVSITPINTSSSSSLSSNLNSVFSGMGLERRPGIEIIPIGSTPPASLPSTITITPIPPSKSLGDDRSRDRKSRDKARSEEEEKRLEKKRKRKREDSPMGPPEKLPPKQDPLSKPVSVSIKPTDSPPMSMSRPSSPAGTLRKFSTSPTHTSPLVLMSKSASSPGGMSKSSKPSPQQSPKHSPAYSTSSPKHNPIPSSASPKHHGTSSPKHTAGSSGKPSMSTLKSAASSPSSGKSSSSDPMKVKPPTSSKDGSSNRDKDRSRMSSSMSTLVSGSSSGGSSSGISSSSGGGGGNGGNSSVSSSGHQSPKLKSASMKVKQPDFSIGSDTTVTPIPPPPPPVVCGPSTSPSSTQDCKLSTSSALPQIRNRKNSLSAIVDKLHTSKSQYTTCDDIAVTVTSGGISTCISSSSSSSGMVISESTSGGNGNRERIPTPTKCTEMKSAGSTGKPGDSGKNPGEYMVKPGSEGIKLTINKTRAKDPSSKSSSSSSSSTGMPSSSMMKSSSQSGSGSPKIHLGHTGLKPGVNSGPASKKPPTSSSSSSSSSPVLPKMPSSGSSSSSGNSSSNSGLKTFSNPSVSKLPSSTVSSSSSSSSSSSIPKSSSSSSSSSISKSVSKSSGSPKLGSSSSSSDPNRIRDSSKPRPPKSSSSGSGGNSNDKSIFSSKDSRKLSPAPPRDEDSDRTFKAITNKLDTPFNLDGFVKQLDTKFQIPKLSARSSNSDSDQSKKTTPEKSESTAGGRMIESTKALDLVKPEAKYSTISPIPSTSPSLPLSVSSSGVTIVPSSKSDEKASSCLSEPKASKMPSSVTSSHSPSPGPRLTPSPLPKLDSKTPTDGSPIPGLTITPIGSITSIGGGGSSSNDSMDLSIDLCRNLSEPKTKGDAQRGSMSIVPSSSKDDLGILSGSPCDSSLSKADKPRDFSMAGDDSKKLALETALLRMEESRSTPPSGSSQDPADVLLDFSGGKVPSSEPPLRKMTVTERVMATLPSRRNTTPPPPMFPASPSVTMHIVKSPMGPSPQSGSPCITDDDLMDEALVGVTK